MKFEHNTKILYYTHSREKDNELWFVCCARYQSFSTAGNMLVYRQQRLLWMRVSCWLFWNECWRTSACDIWEAKQKLKIHIKMNTETIFITFKLSVYPSLFFFSLYLVQSLFASVYIFLQLTNVYLSLRLTSVQWQKKCVMWVSRLIQPWKCKHVQLKQRPPSLKT